jgi:beta-lactamase regulating signal transducer with metallopeptidase domain
MLDSILGLATSPVTTLTAWGQALASWLVPMNVWTVALLAGALLLDRALARRARASWRIVLYAPIALRLLLPLSWKIPVAHAPRVVTLLTPVPEALLPPDPAPAVAPFFTWQAAFVLAYVAVALALVFVRVRARLRLGRELADARPVDARFATASAPCPVLEHAELGPMVVGTVRPRIVLPSLLLAPGEASTLACVLAHELAHVRRRDPWLMAATQVLTVVFWPVLPVWMVAQRVRALVEMACDETALDDADATARSRYGHTLLDMAEWRSVTLAPLGAGELHFGSTLRARIEALANARRWPRAVQVALVALAVVGFAACSSVGSGPSTTSGPATVRASQGQAWSPPPSGEIDNEADLLQYCGALFDMKLRDDTRKMIAAYRSGPTDGLPAEQVAFCRSAGVLDFIDTNAWSSEGRNALGQIGKDIAAAYDKSFAAGRFELCPSGPPVPRNVQAPGVKYQPNWPDDWNDDAGWSCLRFGMDAPMYFRYELVSDGHSFKAIARAQHTNVAGQIVDVTMVLRGQIQPDHVLNIAPRLEETWKVLP